MKLSFVFLLFFTAIFPFTSEAKEVVRNFIYDNAKALNKDEISKLNKEIQSHAGLYNEFIFFEFEKKTPKAPIESRSDRLFKSKNISTDISYNSILIRVYTDSNFVVSEFGYHLRDLFILDETNEDIFLSFKNENKKQGYYERTRLSLSSVIKTLNKNRKNKEDFLNPENKQAESDMKSKTSSIESDPKNNPIYGRESFSVKSLKEKHDKDKDLGVLSYIVLFFLVLSLVVWFILT